MNVYMSGFPRPEGQKAAVAAYLIRFRIGPPGRKIVRQVFDGPPPITLPGCPY